MGTNNLTLKNTGDTIAADDVNQSVSALKGDLVPRNTAGAPADAAGSLGTPTRNWKDVYAKNIYVGNQRIGTGGAAADATISNGVLSAKNDKTTAYDWLHQAGAQGVTLRATEAAPLVVTVGGSTYQLTADLVGGTPLPANYSRSCRLYSAGLTTQNDALFNTSGKEYLRTAAEYPLMTTSSFRDWQEYATDSLWERDAGEIPEYAARYNLLVAGGLFRYSPTASPDPTSDTLIFKATTGGTSEYIPATRYRHNLGLAKLAQRGAMNTHANGRTINFRTDLSHTQALTQVRTGYIFVDPTTSTWTLSIESNLGPTVLDELPTAPLWQADGVMVHREADDLWYRRQSGSWRKTNRVLLGICAIESGQVRAVLPVLTARALSDLDSLATELLTSDGRTRSLDNPIHLRTVTPLNRLSFYYGELGIPLAQSIYSQQATNRYISQNLRAQPPRVQPNTAPAGNNQFFYAYVNLESDVIFSSTQPPNWIHRGDIVYGLNYEMMAVLIGTFARDATSVLADWPRAYSTRTSQRSYNLYPYLTLNGLSELAPDYPVFFNINTVPDAKDPNQPGGIFAKHATQAIWTSTLLFFNEGLLSKTDHIGVPNHSLSAWVVGTQSRQLNTGGSNYTGRFKHNSPPIATMRNYDRAFKVTNDTN